MQLQLSRHGDASLHYQHDETFGESAIECPRTEPEAAAPCDTACFGEFKASAEELNRRKENSGEVVLLAHSHISNYLDNIYYAYLICTQFL